MNEDSEYIYQDLTHILIGCFFHVHNSLGVGFDEKAYHYALERHFRKKGIEHQSKPRKLIVHRGHKVREFEADFIVFEKIILELKALQSNFLQPNYVQIFSELKLWKKKLGLLVNFGLQKVELERIIFTGKSKKVIENYDYIKDLINDSERKILGKLREAIFYIFEAHGLGYGESVYYRLLEMELDFRKINYKTRHPIHVNFECEDISIFKMKPLLVENQIICSISALTDTIDFYDIARVQSYLRALNLKIGIIISFGKNELEIRGVRS
jgi:GxxExxY protein